MVTVPSWHLTASHILLHSGSVLLLLAIALDSWTWVDVLAQPYHPL